MSLESLIWCLIGVIFGGLVGYMIGMEVCVRSFMKVMDRWDT